MKRREFWLDERQVDLVFQAIRDKTDVIQLLMNSVKIMLVNDVIPEDRRRGELILHVSSMSRLFFVSADKLFSINFPFTVLVEEEQSIRFSSTYCDDIDHRVTSEVLSLLINGSVSGAHEIYSLADAVIELQDDSYSLWGLLQQLMTFEDGYLRYDHDPQRVDGRRHPLDHLDLCYSPGSTFKLGFNDRITKATFLDLLDTGSDCHYLDSK